MLANRQVNSANGAVADMDDTGRAAARVAGLAPNTGWQYWLTLHRLLILLGRIFRT